MDFGSFSKEIIDVVEQNSKFLFIRAQRCAELSCQIRAVKNWKTVGIGLFELEVCSLNYKPFKCDKTYRYEVSREPNKTGQTDIVVESMAKVFLSISLTTEGSLLYNNPTIFMRYIPKFA
jgi:hypothetical protein